MRTKQALAIFMLSLMSVHAQAVGCELIWDKIYFKDMIGEKERDPKTRKRTIVYKTFQSFQSHFPKKVSLNIPFKGECDEISFSEVTSYRNIGLRKFPGGEEDHHKHALFPKNTKWETKSFESVKPQVVKNDKLKVFTLSSFRIYDALSTLDFKKYHPWQMRYEVFYRDASGTDNKGTHTVDLKLTH